MKRGRKKSVGIPERFLYRMIEIGKNRLMGFKPTKRDYQFMDYYNYCANGRVGIWSKK